MAISRLIIIDDDVDLGEVIGEIAKFIGYEVDIVTSVNQFHEIYAENPHDVIVADISIPDVEGFGLIDELARISCKSKIIIISGHDEALLRDAKVFAIEKGLDVLAAMRKPFEIDEFENILRKVKK